MSGLAHLFSPIRIRDMELPNRCVMPPMGTNLGNRDATVSEANLAYIKRQAQSGVGLVISEIIGVHPTGTVGIGAYDDQFIPGLKKYADAVHEAGAKAAMQLHHAGREAFFQLRKGTAMGPSAIPSLVYGMAPREMTKDDIRMIIEAFGQAGVRARQAGFDAVEIHGAHGYLLTQFLSTLSNQREDEYGGSFRNRARFVMEVVQEVRKRVGQGFPILLRVSAEEYIKNGYTVEDLQTILPELVEAGVDAIHASIGTHGSPGGITSAPPEFEPGWNVWRAKKIKEAVAIPVIAVGRFNDPRLADEVIGRGETDMVAFGRQQLADPDYLKKAREGRFEDIRLCIACNQGCIERLMLEPGTSIRCAINPETGQEGIYPREPAKRALKVWVVGSGPAGLTAAYEAARLGHNVTVFEKEAVAGGQLRYASQAPEKKVYGDWIDWLIRQLKAKGFEILTETQVTERMLEQGNPEVVILATGGEKIVPAVPGLDRAMVCDAFEILGHRRPVGRNVVVAGGGLIGMETADFIASQGGQVTLIEMLKHSPVNKITSHGYFLHKRLRAANCRLLFNTRLERIEETSVVTVSDGKEEVISPVDQVVIAVGLKSRDDLKNTLKERGIRHYIVGDAAQVRRIIEAVDEGAKAAWDLHNV
jgi:2,4-dienoyl-CoA reductase-like NADH-dependent reductase (Old Yellow Enzyme family)/thioredoxin reductase